MMRKGFLFRRKIVPERSEGFTLVEMLVVMSVLSIVSVFILNIFTRSLRGSNKSQIIGTIKQNGQSVLENMDKTVRNADNVVCPVITPPDTSITSPNLVVVKNGIYTRYIFTRPISTTANGLIQQDNPIKQPVADSNPPREETDYEFRNRVCSSQDASNNKVNPITLTDTKLNTGISVNCIASNCDTNPIFRRDRSAGFRDQVTIKFDIGPPVGAPQAVTGQIDSVSFQTTIQLR